MKILFTADWHIKLGQKLVPIEWQINRYKLLMKLLSKETDIDLMIIGGDIFDRIPTLDELSLYFSLMTMINVSTIIYPGNHEALGKNTTFLTKLEEVTSAANSKITTVDKYMSTPEFSVLPYNELKNFAANPKNYEVSTKILFTHARGEIPPYVTPELPLEYFDAWDVVFAGDLHSHSNSQRNIVYPGSPLTTTFHRNEVDTGYIVVDTDTLKWEWKKLNIPQLIRKTVNDPKLMIPTDFHHTVYEIEGDISDLAKIEKHELLDKKIVSTVAESKLNLHKDMKVSEELELFLTDIMKLQSDDIKEILTTYHAYITEDAME